MIAILSSMTLGVLLGMRHAGDADHVLAVSTIVARHRTLRGGLAVGAVWGLGHTLTILVVGGAMIVFRVAVPPALGLTMEMTVAVMLVALGVSSLRGARPERPESVACTRVEPPDAIALSRLLRPLVVGLAHGLAGSAAVVLLVLGSIDDPRWALAYLALFGVGTVVGMMLITAAIAAPMAYAARRSGGVDRHLRVATGVLSVAVGLVLVSRLGLAAGP
jgi:high-affinity nickel-transport protein